MLDVRQFTVGNITRRDRKHLRFRDIRCARQPPDASSLPADIGANVSAIESIFATGNYFTGSLPSSISLCSHLLSLSVSDNCLSGSLPLGLTSLSRLQYFNASFNHLNGAVTNLFEASDGALVGLVTIDLSVNALSGQLPPGLFTSSPNNSDIIMFSNCFSGSLPPSICSAQSLKVLVLDSVTSALACEEKLSPVLARIFKVVIGRRRLLGGIPSCIWDGMPSLNTVHLSGNGLKGTLGELMSGLTDVSLSSNRLSGTIPLSRQTSLTLTNVDLCHLISCRGRCLVIM
jgi:hypothetical protein